MAGRFTYIKNKFKRLVYGRLNNDNYISAEKKVAKEKMPAITKKFSYFKRLKCFYSGFNSDKLVWYDFDKYKKSDYISDIEHYRDYEMLDWKYYYIAHNKLVCERYFSNYCNTIPTIGYIEKGMYHNISSDKEVYNAQSLLKSVKDGNDFYLKPVDGGSGRGIGRLSCKGGNIYWNNDVLSDAEAFIASLTGYIVQRRFVQEGFSHEYNPNTLNTLRVVTMLSPKTNEPFVACSVHRLGRADSFVDNIAKKAILCPINVETGVMEYGVLYPSDAELRYINEHPDTNVKISGVKVHNWDKIVETCKKLHLQIPFMPICGWDIVVSGDDVYMQELNYNPDIYLGQVLKPLLLDPRVKEFHDYYIKNK